MGGPRVADKMKVGDLAIHLSLALRADRIVTDAARTGSRDDLDFARPRQTLEAGCPQAGLGRRGSLVCDRDCGIRAAVASPRQIFSEMVVELGARPDDRLGR